MPPVLRLFNDPPAKSGSGSNASPPGPPGSPPTLTNFFGSSSNAESPAPPNNSGFGFSDGSRLTPRFPNLFDPSAPPLFPNPPNPSNTPMFPNLPNPSNTPMFPNLPGPSINPPPFPNLPGPPKPSNPPNPPDLFGPSNASNALNTAESCPLPKRPNESDAPGTDDFCPLPKRPKTSDTESPKTDTIHIIRHAEGLHNVVADGGNVPDPYLTTLGLTQCAHIQRIFPHDIDVLIASPLKRTIQTAIFCFGKALEGGAKKIHLIPELQEVGGYPCNTVSPPKDLIEEFGSVIDASRLSNSRNNYTSEAPQYVQSRATLARGAIQQVINAYRLARPDAGDINVVVVSHGRFIPYLTQDFALPMWHNTAFRSYQFSKPTMTLKETDQSIAARNGGKLTLRISEEDNKRGMELQSNFITRRGQAQASNSTIFDFSNPINQ